MRKNGALLNTSKFTATTFSIRCSVAISVCRGGSAYYCPSCLRYVPGTRRCCWFLFVQRP
nr:MAG TPA: Dynactin p62 family [Caudoviricetes sp.]